MTPETSTSNKTERRSTRSWSVESFKKFWDHPDPTVVPGALAPDVVGHWPGVAEPVYGREAYAEQIEMLLRALPDLRLDVAEHAVNGAFTFVRWIMRATGKHGPFEMTGIDRVRLEDGLVAENVIVYDTARFEALSGHRAGYTRPQ